jgi:hypothetical protein
MKAAKIHSKEFHTHIQPAVPMGGGQSFDGMEELETHSNCF